MNVSNVNVDNLSNAEIKLELQYDDPKEAGSMYGELLDLDNRSKVYYLIDNPKFIIDGDHNYSTDQHESWYTVEISIAKIPLNKLERMLAILLEPDPKEITEAKLEDE